MTTGPKHYVRAEQLLAESERTFRRGLFDDASALTARAYVHATLALAAATALPSPATALPSPATVEDPDEDYEAWIDAASVYSSAAADEIGEPS